MPSKFSIILPTYNRAHLIGTAIASVVAQSETDWQLLIVDDGSTDNTKEVVFGFQDRRIMYYQIPQNQGRSTARNIGLQGATGEWICFLDSDDWYLEDHLETFAVHIAKHPDVSIFKTGVSFEKPDGSLLKQSRYYAEEVPRVPFVISNYCSVLDVCIRREIAVTSSFPVGVSAWEDKAYLIAILNRYPWHQIELHTVVALEHIDRSIIHLHKDVDSINKTLTLMEQMLSDVRLKDNYLGPTQQNFILSVMVDATEMGMSYTQLKSMLRAVQKNVMPLTWLRYWRIRLLG